MLSGVNPFRYSEHLFFIIIVLTEFLSGTLCFFAPSCCCSEFCAASVSDLITDVDLVSHSVNEAGDVDELSAVPADDT